MIKLKDILLETAYKPIINIKDGSHGFTVTANDTSLGYDDLQVGSVNIELRPPQQVMRNGNIEMDQEDYGRIGGAEVIKKFRRKGIYRDMILAALEHVKKKGKKGLRSDKRSGPDQYRSDYADLFWDDLKKNQSKYRIKVTQDEHDDFYLE